MRLQESDSPPMSVSISSRNNYLCLGNTRDTFTFVRCYDVYLKSQVESYVNYGG